MTAISNRNAAHLQYLTASARAAVGGAGLGGSMAQVVLVMDVSRPMYKMYRGGSIQELATQLLALGMQLDDDGVIPCWAFGEDVRSCGDLRVADFPGFVDRQVIRTGADYQLGCRYAGAIDAVGSFFFPDEWATPPQTMTVGRFLRKRRVNIYPSLKQPRLLPTFAVVVTAGDCEDHEAAAEAIRRSSHLPIFWQFVGIADPFSGERPDFSFLKRLDRLDGTHVDNCGFFEPRDYRDAHHLFDGLLNEFPQYLRQPQVQAMLMRSNHAAA